MGDFRRTRSKVWWSNYFDVDDASEEVGGSFARLSWRRSLKNVDNCSNGRNSSSSPSSGSHKSQDSGFSDSESSSPTNIVSKANRVDEDQVADAGADNTENVTDNANAAISNACALPVTPMMVNRIPRPNLIRRKKSGKSGTEPTELPQRNSIGDCIADCYFPFGGASTSEPAKLARYKSPLTAEEQLYLETVLSNSRTTTRVSPTPSSTSSSVRSSPPEARTCFIVDELPKKNNVVATRTTDTVEAEVKTSTISSETLSSSSSSSSDECKENDTVRFVNKKEDEVPKIPSPNHEVQVEPVQTDESCKRLDFEESRFSNLDLTNFPEPTHTSTPNKDERPASILTRLPARNKPIISKATATAVDEKKSFKPVVHPPVAKWLREMKCRYEPECMTTLQAKTVAVRCKRKRTSTISESNTSMRTFQNKTKVIADEFLKLYEILNDRAYEQIESQLRSMINSVMEFVINYAQLLPRMESAGKENLLRLMDMCDRLRQTACSYAIDQPSLLNDITTLEKFFSRFVDSVLAQQIALLAASLENPKSDSILLNALTGITSLTSNTSHSYELITHFNGIENLLTISVQSSSPSIRKAAFRALAVVCQSANSIRRFEKARGIEILSLLLSDTSRSENEMMEIVSVLVQITAPWIEDDHIIKGLIYHLHPIINSLTRLISNTNSCETLLLSAAALANISFIEPQAVFVLLEMDTANHLLTAVRKLGARATVFLQEQVATLIANMAAVPETRSHLARHRAVGALLCFLQIKHSPVQTPAELAAAERLQHKSAIALSRLCTNVEVSKQVVELQGVNQLVRLCKEEQERNFNDDILVACLASLRKITANCGNESISHLNAEELVKPRLVDSFLLYSSRQESYV